MHSIQISITIASRSLLTAVLAGCLNLQAAPVVSAETTVGQATAFDYRIAPRDQIKFQITGETEDPLLQRVSSGGEISVPLLGAVKVVGLTLRETESLIEKRYREGGFYLNPQVILSFEAYAPRVISVLGQVNNPIQVEFSIEREQMGIVGAITRAGGFTRVAQTDSVKVMRTVEGKETIFKVNVASYLNETAKEQEFRLLPDDVVFVPERVF
jgi:protein involved in polysaccharide export with SLBB domain